jgi:hypothetical protein
MVSRDERDAESESFPNKKPATCVVTISRTPPGPSTSSTSTQPYQERSDEGEGGNEARDRREERFGAKRKPLNPNPIAEIEESMRTDKPRIPVSKTGSPTPHFRNAPPTKLKHPLEENIFTSLLITLLAVSLAILCGVPVLLLTGTLLLIALTFRYLTVIIQGLFQYLAFICSNRNVPANRAQPQVFPDDRSVNYTIDFSMAHHVDFSSSYFKMNLYALFTCKQTLKAQ